MKNFDYLKDIPELSTLYTFCNAAEMTQQTDYDNCAANCRKALEWMVRAVYKLKNKVVEERATLFDLITGAPYADLVKDDRPLSMATHYIRKIGNVAVHQGGTTRKEAFFAFLNTYNLIGGILLKFGVLEALAPFDKDLIPKKPAPFVAPQPEVPEPTSEFVQAVPTENVAKPLEVTVEVDDFTEAETRRLFIDLMLREAGWEVLDKENVPCPCKAGIEIEVEGMPNGKGVGYCDYVLYGKDGKPLAVVEAKRTSVDEAKGKHQAELYADCLEKQYGVRPVIYYSNGFATKIIDGLGYPPRPVLGFHTLEDLEWILTRRTRVELKDLSIKDEISNRDYQKRGIRAVCQHLNEQHRRALLVMATGTGKTRTAISLCDVLLRKHWVKNVLFLADRITLVDQAYRNFGKLLPEYTTCILTGAKEEEKKARLMFSTYQTMINYIDSEDKEFSIGRFDLIILDEAHRSIFGKYTAIFSYFDSFLVGLTATPRDEVDRSTYELFHLESGEPNFSYSQEEAEQEHYLVGYNPISRTTTRMREGIKYDTLSEEEKEQLDKAWEYEKAKKEMETGELQEKTPRNIEKKELFDYIFNKGTVDIVLQDLMKNGLKVQNGDLIGKTVIFAYNHDHAQLIVDRFYALYPHLGSKFCQLIDYSVKYAQDIIDNFKISAKMPQIAVSVDMLDTGIDVPEILNLVFFKPVYSKIKYIQMVGRGTRLCEHIFADGSDKTEFYIFDWCENFEYFGSGSNGREPLASLSLTERLFALRLDVAVTLQHQKYQGDEFAKAFCQQLKDELFEQVAQLNELFASVRIVWETVVKFKNKDNWVFISELDALELKEKIAPILFKEKNENEARMFDALMFNIMLSYLLFDYDATRSKNKVMRIAEKLRRKATIPAVKDHMPTIEAISNPAFWKAPSLDKLEKVRLELRDIVYVTMGSMHERFYIDISDTFEEKTGVKKPVFETDYHTRILDYLNDHRDLDVIKKIKRLEKLTDADISELERICWKELGSKEEYEKYINRKEMICGDSVAAFIRSIVGVDRQLAKEKFSQFLNNSPLNALQDEYINQIIGYVCENGDITPETLYYNEDFANLDWRGVFGPNLPNVGKYVRELHSLIG